MRKIKYKMIMLFVVGVLLLGTTIASAATWAQINKESPVTGAIQPYPTEKWEYQ